MEAKGNPGESETKRGFPETVSDVTKTCHTEQNMTSGSWSTRCPDHPLSSAPQVPQRPKRVRFYKSGDPHFSGLQVVINSRAFKTFDALLDNLSKKVPLPFGVRNITTPRGTRVVQSLDELEDGKSYLCSDKRKIHPINLDVVSRRPLCWLAGRVTGDVVSRLTNPEDAPLVHTPKWLMVFRNGDAGIKHRVDLQAIQTWESVLESMSEVLHIPVQKIYTTDGRKVNTSDQPGNTNSLSSGLKSKKDIASATMSDSSTSSLFDYPSNRTTSEEVVMNNTSASDPILCTADGRASKSLLPPDGDIEKSFCINEDGSMTVEMKVRLKVKEKEILHWTTTLMRSTVAKRRRPGCDPRPESMAVPPDLDDIPNICNRYKSSEDLAQARDQLDKPCFWRPGTPGPRHTRNLESVESLSTSSDTAVVENVIGAYSPKEEGPNMDKTKGHRVVRPIPKPRMVKLAEAECNKVGCISQVSEVLQMQEKLEEIPGTTSHRRKQQSCYSNEVNTEDQNVCELLYQHSVSEDTAPLSSSCERDAEPNHDKIMTFKRSSYKDEKVNCKGKRASFEETVVTKVRSGASDVISNESHFPLSEDFVGKTPERYRRTQLSEDTSNQWSTAREDERDTEVEGPSSSGFVEIPKDLLDFVNSALHSSTLSFSYDSKGSLKIEVEGTNIKLTHRIPRSSTDVQYDQRRLPSPNTSDLSDYAPEMTESDEIKSQESVELITESEEDHSGGPPGDRDCVQSKTGRGEHDEVEVSVLKASFSAPPIKENQNQAFNRSSGRAMADDITAGPVDACDKPEQGMVHSTSEDMSEGVLIDKGRWLLKENHLIRMSPPGPMGMYGNTDTTSASTGQDNGSDDIPASYFVGPASITAALSSSELEEMVKPGESTEPAYFAMRHGSDSDPFQDELSSRSSTEDTVATSRESKVDNKEEVSIYSNTKNPGTWAKRMSRLKSFTSVEFKIPDGKVYPSTAPSGVVPADVQDANIQNHRARMVQEQGSVNRLHFPCGPHCPIL
ncbi:oxygen-regulated protein 1 [Brienomyrus brachyistius]|uniref:oxygen-regulated protein 1 n=1 Tax=Brienomyrus brachyistius TaxID=42636 RepID=UPI0020B28C18|nr:oxygen-regulated protein 1 [Brienomyrus brachyistius]